MRWSSLVTCAAAIAGAVPAAADTIASPPIYGGRKQVDAFCRIFNNGNTAIPIQSIELWSDDGSHLASSSPCNSSILPLRTCSVSGGIGTDNAWSCRVTLTGKANARGSVEIIDSSGTVLNRADLR